MAPYIEPEAQGSQSHQNLDTANGFATGDAHQTLKAVQGLIGAYFAKTTVPGLGSAPTTGSAITLPPQPTGKGLGPGIMASGLGRTGRAEGVPATHPGGAAGDGVEDGKPLAADLVAKRGSPPASLSLRTGKSPGNIGTDQRASKMASNGVNGNANGNGVTGLKPQSGPGPKPPGPLPLDPERLRSLAAEITSSVDRLTTSSGPDAKAAHMQAAKAAFELTASLRSPPEVIMGWFSTGSIVSAVRLFQEWGVFDAIPALVPGGAGPPGISFSELAAKVEAEESLLVRVSWMLTSNSILKHIPSTPAHLAHTPTSMLLRTGSPIAAMFKLMYTNIVEVSTILPPYFNNYGRREPLGPAHIPCTFLAGEPELEYFQHINADPARIANFMLAMGITHRNVPTTGMYPMDGVLAAAKANPSRPIWVDVGGGDGHTVKIFRSTYGLPAEQCIIQDLPEVITAAQSAAASSPSDELTGVKFIPMDFHRDAPVPGARAYYLRHILRDYSDPTAVNILKNLKKGLTEADSRILIAEQVIEDQPPAYAAFKDFAMLAIGGKERTVEGFKEIAERAGLEVSGVFRDGVQAAHAVVEMRVKV